MKHPPPSIPPSLILDHLAVGVFTVDSEFRITSFNARAEELTGFGRHDALGHLCFEIFRADKCFEGPCPLRLAMDNMASLVRERATILCKNNQERPVEITAAVLRDASGGILGGVETILDDSDRTALEKKVKGSYRVGDIIGRSPLMIALFESLPALAATDIGVLILGETGTGKGLVAKALHNSSHRRAAPFIKVNCAALPANLLESELFGYRKGAFTDARKDKPGMFELAHGGTLFLDEIGEMDFGLQSKLLQAIEDKEFYPLGATKPVKVDSRIIASTNRHLADFVKQGLFRADLYYRLQVAQIDLPPLRERREDIPLLLEHFLRELPCAGGRRRRGLSPSAMRLVMEHDFPGNVRELRNILEYAAILQQDERITDQDLPRYLLRKSGEITSEDQPFNSLGDASSAPRTGPPPPPDAPPRPDASDGETTCRAKELLEQTLRQTFGDRRRAARMLGISRTTLWRRMKQFGVRE
ncbi:sigma-54 interaction domain-containing protein [Desulfolutivibrio sulfoxidireducens]|uniref:sigma-54 interaction domain-containing protein n=1 Tax=Desulfolutivibrio sulfoxidireducens TaxID=2773299 RepID=UPI00159D3EBA|nr:sigma 54-interacting transcriptional regulator [Desulfolutivibrio sulfoxidireducens]QLA18690.1 PAS domain-containing protein [Desulfolutivibrio sulfoxidireducens]